MGLFNKVFDGARWGVFKIVSVQLINLVTIAILSRVLSLADFGLVALANSALIFFNVFASQGLNNFLIFDNSENYEEKVNSVFWLNVIVSVSITCIAIAMIPVIMDFFNESLLEKVLLVLFFRFPFDVLSKLPDAILHKKLKFKDIEIRDTILQFLSSCSSVFMALNGYGVWSLIIPSLVASPIRLVISFSLISWRPKLQLYYQHWKEIISYSKNIIGSSLTNYTLTQGDTIMVGVVFGSSAVGVYNLAWQLSNLFSKTIVKLINKLAFPTFSSFNGNIKLIKTTLSKVLFIISIISFPVLMFMFVSAEHIILTVYGDKWVQSIIPFQILLIYAIRYSVGSPIGSIFKSMGRPDINFKLGLSIIPFYLIGIWLGSFYNVIGVAIAVTTVRSVFGLASFWIAGNLLKSSFLSIIRPLRMPFIASLIMCIFCFVFDNLVLKYYFNLAPLYSLLITLTFSGLLYFILVRFVFKDIWTFIESFFINIKLIKRSKC